MGCYLDGSFGCDRGKAKRGCRRAPAGWLPGQLAPVLVEWLGPTGRPDREVWDAEAGDRTAKRLVTTAVEHHAVLHVCESLARANRVNLQFAGVDREGLVDPDAGEELLDDDTVLVSVIHANTGREPPCSWRKRPTLMHVSTRAR